MEPIVSTRWLLARLYEPELVIVDCRFLLTDPEAGRKAYTEEHIPGAVYLHLEEQLSAPVSSHGGRHPLPEISKLTAALSKVGINRDSIVVSYDDQGGAYASRLWWMLKYLGHERVFVMDEGYSAWKKHPSRSVIIKRFGFLASMKQIFRRRCLLAWKMCKM